MKQILKICLLNKNTLLRLLVINLTYTPIEVYKTKRLLVKIIILYDTIHVHVYIHVVLGLKKWTLTDGCDEKLNRIFCGVGIVILQMSLIFTSLIWILLITAGTDYYNNYNN